MSCTSPCSRSSKRAAASNSSCTSGRDSRIAESGSGVCRPETTSSPCARGRNSPYGAGSPIDRVAAEQHAGAGRLVQVAEDHGLHGHGRAEVIGDPVVLAVATCAPRVPRLEDGADRTPQLLVHVFRNRPASRRGDCRSPAFDVVPVAEARGLGLQYGPCIELDEAPTRVAREFTLAALVGQGALRRRVDAQVEDGVHHPGHGHRGAGAHGHQQRSRPGAETPSRALLQPRHAGREFLVQARRQVTAFEERDARLGGQDEGRRHVQAERAHLRDRPGLAADQLAAGQAAVRRDAAANGVLRLP